MSDGASQSRTESRVSWKDVLWVIGSAGAALLGISLATGNWLIPKRQPREQPPAWNQGTINAGYIGSQLRETDKRARRWSFLMIWRTTPIQTIASMMVRAWWSSAG